MPADSLCRISAAAADTQSMLNDEQIVRIKENSGGGGGDTTV